MKIDGNNPIVNLKQLQNEEIRQLPEGREKQTAGTDSRDRLELSTTARQIDLYQQTVREAPEVRAEKVAEISQKLETLSYDIRAEEVADSLINGNILDEVV